MTNKTIRIGGASGFWGDAARSTPQLLDQGNVDVIVYDYLAEITMSIMARARAKNPDTGYALDFVSTVLKPNLKEIARQGVKIISNAGGVNPKACAEAVRQIIKEQGLDLKVACVLGDDLIAQREEIAQQGHQEMFSGEPFPAMERVVSINAYLGAFPVARGLGEGADIVITGRCVDSAVTLGACIDAFDWDAGDADKLAGGSLAGHILECGPQATGGNFTDWALVNDIDNIGYPITEISADGSFVCSKAENTGGLVSVGTVAEQMLYEIGDPQAYLLPDVVCDFSQVEIEQIKDNLVRVTGAKGLPAPSSYKVCATYADQFRGGTNMTFYGIDAEKKAHRLAEAIFKASRKTLAQFGLPDFTETSVELIGAESQFGDGARLKDCRELSMKIAVKHCDAAGIGILLKECVGLGLATPPGLSGFAGARPKPSPVVRLYSFELPKTAMTICVEIDGLSIDCSQPALEPESTVFDRQAIVRPASPMPVSDANTQVSLIDLALGRSGDKGDKANIGIIARKPEYLPYIYAALTEHKVAELFAHFLPQGAVKNSGRFVERYLLPGSHSINFLLHQVLGGGGMASIRNDPQGKGFAQLLLTAPILVPTAMAVDIVSSQSTTSNGDK